MLMVSTVGMTSTISTQPTSNFFLLTVHLLKVPPGPHASACLIPLKKKLTNTSLIFLITHDVRVLGVAPLVKFIIIIHMPNQPLFFSTLYTHKFKS